MRTTYLVTLAALSSGLLNAACEDSQSLDSFVLCVPVADKLSKNAPGKQADAPSLATNSTTLVDQSSSGDLLTAAMNLSGFSQGANQGRGVVVSATGYAVYAAITHQDPLDPYVYSSYAALRRVSFSLGADVPDDPTNQASARGDIYGAKFLLTPARDPTTISKGLSQVLEGAVTNDTSAWRRDLENWLYGIYCQCDAKLANPNDIIDFRTNKLMNGKWSAFYGMLIDAQKRELVSKIVASGSPTLALAGAVRTAVRTVRNAPQWSIEGLTKRRGADAGNDYRLQMIYDRGLLAQTMFIANAGFDYTDFNKIGADTRGGRAAVEFRTALAGDNPLKSAPLTLSVTGEGKWMAGSKPAYRAQAKLVIPLGMPGLELPISFTYSTRRDLIQETDVRGQVGFTIDPAKLLEALRK